MSEKHEEKRMDEANYWGISELLKEASSPAPVAPAEPPDTSGVSIQWNDGDHFFVARGVDYPEVTGHGATRAAAIAMWEDNYQDWLADVKERAAETEPEPGEADECPGCAAKVDHYCWNRGGRLWSGETSPDTPVAPAAEERKAMKLVIQVLDDNNAVRFNQTIDADAELFSAPNSDDFTLAGVKTALDYYLFERLRKAEGDEAKAGD